MFSGPEYASYVALCRELRLEREFTAGDFYAAPVPVSVIAPEGFEVLIWVDLFRLPHATQDCAWLPRLDQWLAMLEEAGVESVTIQLAWTNPEDPGEKEYVAFDAWDVPDADDLRNYTSREEAAAQLWVAVTGTPAQPRPT